jgi:hypothetical protein
VTDQANDVMVAPLAAVDPEPLSVMAVPTQYGPGETEMLAVGLGLTVTVMDVLTLPQLFEMVTVTL